MASAKRIVVVLPRATAAFPSLEKADPGPPAKGGKKPVPKFKVKSLFDADTDFTALNEKIKEAIAAEWGPKIKPAVVKSCIKDGDAENQAREDNGKDKVASWEGKFIIDAASQFKPECRDAKKNLIDASLIKGGDIIRAMVQLIPCEPNGRKTIGVRLLAVQLVEKKAGGDGWGSGFEEEEGGFVADKDAAPRSRGDDDVPPPGDESDYGGGDEDF